MSKTDIDIEKGWKDVLKNEFNSSYFHDLKFFSDYPCYSSSSFLIRLQLPNQDFTKPNY